MIHVFLADDHPIVREGLKRILTGAPDIILDGEADNGLDVLKKSKGEKWDVLLLDLSLPGKHGLEVLKELRESKPELRVLILSIHPEFQYALRVIKAGAAGYLSKDCIPERLIQAIRKVHIGGRYVSETLGEHLSRLLDHEPKKEPHENLSKREFQIFMMLVEGKKISDIAHELNLSAKTVATHRMHILEKMNCSSNMDIIRYAMQRGLVPS